MIRDALLSPDGTYRWWLTRQWGHTAALTFILLNPSKADAAVDDPTVRRGISFAKRFGFGGMTFLNLFAYRATKPEDMMAAPDPIGPEGDEWLYRAFAQARIYDHPVICAWGAGGGFRGRSDDVVAMAKGVRLCCLGKTRGGQPRHPVRLANATPLEQWP